MSENLPARVKFFRDSIQQIIDSRAEPSYDMLRSLLVEDERLAEWERRTGTAPQEAQADPQMVTCFQCRGDGTCFATDDPCPVCGGLGSITDDVAPVPQTEGGDK